MEMVIKGWVCKDKCYWRSDWYPAKFFEKKPVRVYAETVPRWIWDEDDHWEMKEDGFEIKLSEDMFPELTWEDEPIKAELTIKTL